MGAALPTRTAGPRLAGQSHLETSALQGTAPPSEPPAQGLAAGMQFQFSAMMLDPQRLVAAYLDLATLGRLATGSVGLCQVTAAAALWARHLDALGVQVCPSVDLGCHATLRWQSGSSASCAAVGARASGGGAEPSQPTLLLGARVRLRGLARAELNGREGTVSAPAWRERAPLAERVPVLLEGEEGAPGQRLLVSPRNLEPLQAPSEGAAAGGDPRRLLRDALQALRANEEFYAAFRAGDARRMRALWLDDSSLGAATAAELLGAGSPEDGRVVCVHPGYAPLLGHSAICQSWDQILRSGPNSSASRMVDIWPIGGRWVLDTEGRAYVSLVERLGPGVSVQATNAFVRAQGAWHMVAHVASSG